MVAGRGVAQLITDGQIITINSAPYKLIGGGYWLTLPFSHLRGGRGRGPHRGAHPAHRARHADRGGRRQRRGQPPGRHPVAGASVLVYVFCALCAGIAGLMISSNVSGADGNNAGLWIELDAILAVVIGGTSLAGGRFSLGGTVIGALIIQTLTTTIYTIGIPPQTTLLFKAVVVIVVCLLQSPAFRAKVFGADSAPAAPRTAAPSRRPRPTRRGDRGRTEDGGVAMSATTQTHGSERRAASGATRLLGDRQLPVLVTALLSS